MVKVASRNGPDRSLRVVGDPVRLAQVSDSAITQRYWNHCRRPTLRRSTLGSLPLPSWPSRWRDTRPMAGHQVAGDRFSCRRSAATEAATTSGRATSAFGRGLWNATVQTGRRPGWSFWTISGPAARVPTLPLLASCRASSTVGPRTSACRLGQILVLVGNDRELLLHVDDAVIVLRLEDDATARSAQSFPARLLGAPRG
jgi:hypothetical protein